MTTTKIIRKENGMPKAIKIEKKKDDLYIVNGKTIYKDMNDNWCGRTNLEDEELVAFQERLQANETNQIEVIEPTIVAVSIPRKRIFTPQIIKTREPANNYETYVLAVLTQFNRKIIRNAKLSKTKREIIAKINLISAAYNPKEPINPIWYSDEYNDRHLKGIEFAKVTLVHGYLKY